MLETSDHDRLRRVHDPTLPPACPLCRADATRRFLGHAGFEVHACIRCGLRFLHPHPTAEALKALYGPQYFGHEGTTLPGYDRYLEEVEHHRRTFDDRLRLLPLPAPGARLLDVGASIGVFVERARRVGWDAEGIEPSRWASTQAREQFGQPVATGTLEGGAFAPASFDLVSLWEVIEHLPSPRDTIREARRILRPGGHLALSTPDAGSLVARAMGQRWPGWRKLPEHLFFFDRRTLSDLLEAEGFTIERRRYVSLTVSRGYLVDRILEVLGRSTPVGTGRRWRDGPVRINPLYDLFILARVR